jgi:hypothetical protein
MEDYLINKAAEPPGTEGEVSLFEDFPEVFRACLEPAGWPLSGGGYAWQ